MAERVLSRGELNRALLARQLLLQRAAVPVARAVERVGGLQTQYAPSAYVGLWSRVAGFERAALTAALQRARVVQGWVMRCTIHMVSAADYAPLTAAVREPRRQWWLRVQRSLADVDWPAAAAHVRAVLADGPRPQAELAGALAERGFPRAAFAGTQLWADLVRVPPAGTWERPRAHVYGLASAMLGAAAPDEAAETAEVVAAGEELLVRRYLAGFGPASASDVARYAGWTVSAARRVLDRLDLRRMRDESGTELVDLRRAPLPAAGTLAPVRFLSTFDAVLLLGHATRAGILPEQYRAQVFHTSKPQSVPTFLVDGRVAGTWRFADGPAGRRVDWQAFSVLPTPAVREVEEEAQRLAAFAAD